VGLGVQSGEDFLGEVLGPSPATSIGIGLSMVSLATAATTGVAGAAANPTVGTHRAFVLAALPMVVGAIVAFVLVKPDRARSAQVAAPQMSRD
jgi:hypothetical protein